MRHVAEETQRVIVLTGQNLDLDVGEFLGYGRCDIPNSVEVPSAGRVFSLCRNHIECAWKVHSPIHVADRDELRLWVGTQNRENAFGHGFLHARR